MPVARNSENPAKQAIPTDLFIEEYCKIGPSQMARKYKLSDSGIRRRRRYIERQRRIVMTGPDNRHKQRRIHPVGQWMQMDNHPAAIQLGIQDGHILVGSDSHYWPGIVSTAHNAFVEFAKEFKPKVIVKNGDEMDFPSISRHAPIAWEKRPKVSDEVENTKAMLSEIEKASPKSRRIWTLGNHDARFETRLATLAPEYANVKGVHLKDHFPNWEPCWAALVNEHTVIKHRIKGGMYATRNNTLFAGRSVITGHLHSLKVWPHSDYNGTRFGGDCGTMADPFGPQFYNYTELNPVDWRSGFVLLTIFKGRLLWPEIIFVRGLGEIEFRGKVMKV